MTAMPALTHGPTPVAQRACSRTAQAALALVLALQTHGLDRPQPVRESHVTSICIGSNVPNCRDLFGASVELRRENVDGAVDGVTRRVENAPEREEAVGQLLFTTHTHTNSRLLQLARVELALVA